MNGIIVVNKERGYTSRDVVNIISNTLHTKKVGQTGTLDPMAEGVLVITVGKCTKLCDYLTSEYKEYIAEFDLGYLTDTLDSTGNILKTSDIVVNYNDVINVVNSFKGKYNQIVPLYSAVKINGKKLYEYARNNIDINLPSREVDIKKIELLSFGKNIKMRCLVSKGTYIRSLIRDIGDKLGTYATMTSLIRTKSGKFNIENSFILDDIKNGNYKLITIDEIFSLFPKINIDNEMYKSISNGNIVDNKYGSEYVLFYYKDELISIYKVYKKSKMKPFLMF